MLHELGLSVARSVVFFLDEALVAVIRRLHEARHSEDVFAALDESPHLELSVVVLDELPVGLEQRLEQLDGLLEQHLRGLEVDQSLGVEFDDRHSRELASLHSLDYDETWGVSGVHDVGGQVFFELGVVVEDADAVEVGVLSS